MHQPAAQLGRAAALLPAQGDRRAAPRHAGADRPRRGDRRRGRRRGLVAPRAPRTCSARAARSRPSTTPRATTSSTSGSTRARPSCHVLRGSHPGTTNPDDDGRSPEADLYLEGHDQHRGWFHSSLLIACAIEGHAPYRGLLTHGFTVDGSGRKMSKSLGNFIAPARDRRPSSAPRSSASGARDRLLGRPGDRRQGARPRRRRLPAHPQHAALPARQHERLRRRRATPCRSASCSRSTAGRWRARAALQAEIVRPPSTPARGVFDGGHYGVYEFHPVVAKLQVFCSEDLGAFYLDILKDRLYTTAPARTARRSAQTALWHIAHAMLRWMAPFLSFTAEEAWQRVRPGADRRSIFVETYWSPPTEAAPGRRRLLGRGGARPLGALRDLRDGVNKEIEALRSRRRDRLVAAGRADDPRRAADARAARVVRRRPALPARRLAGALERGAAGERARSRRRPSAAPKCERCWHYRADVGIDPAHPTLCGRCTSNLFGARRTSRRSPEHGRAAPARRRSGPGSASPLAVVVLDQLDQGADRRPLRARRRA